MTAHQLPSVESAYRNYVTRLAQFYATEAIDRARVRSLFSAAPRFASVSCSQCGREFGPGNHGFSHCRSHAGR